MSGGGSPKFTPTSTRIDPALSPYRDMAMRGASQLYGQGTPQYFQGQTWVDPSQATQSALQMAQQRASTGSPLVQTAQQQNLATMNGDYLNGNPFFDGAFKAATQSATNQFNDSVNSALSNASMAGRYGSNAMGNVINRTAQTYADSLNNTAGTLAYNNYATERGYQNQAIQQAPALANQDYYDMERMLQAGQIGEGYDRDKIAAQMDEWAYNTQAPYQLQSWYGNFLSGLPQGSDTMKYDSKVSDADKAEAMAWAQSRGLI